MRRCLPLLLLCLVGCSPKPPLPGPSGSGHQIVDDTVAQFVVRDGQVAAVVWSDFLGRDCTVGSASGWHDSGDGRRVEWAFTGERAEDFAVRINGREYRTSAGRVFLVSTAGGPVEVRQLDRDPGEGAASIAALVRSDQEIREFVASAQKRSK